VKTLLHEIGEVGDLLDLARRADDLERESIGISARWSDREEVIKYRARVELLSKHALQLYKDTDRLFGMVAQKLQNRKPSDQEFLQLAVAASDFLPGMYNRVCGIFLSAATSILDDLTSTGIQKTRLDEAPQEDALLDDFGGGAVSASGRFETLFGVLFHNLVAFQEGMAPLVEDFQTKEACTMQFITQEDGFAAIRKSLAHLVKAVRSGSTRGRVVLRSLCLARYGQSPK
jgi:hypothetical protein